MIVETEVGTVCGELMSEDAYGAWIASHPNAVVLGVKRMILICYGNLPEVDSAPPSDQADGTS